MRVWYQIAKSILKVYVTLFVEDIRVSGLENIFTGPKIIVANHPNATDAFMLPLIFPEQLHFLIQASIFDVPFIGRLLAHADQIPVITGKGRQALGLAQKILVQGGSVVIFPEGRLNNDQGLHGGQIGAAKLAVETDVPILPLGFYVPPSALREFKRRIDNRAASSRWQIGGSCFIRVGQPVQIEPARQSGDHSRNLEYLTEQIMSQIGELVYQAKQDACDRC